MLTCVTVVTCAVTLVTVTPSVSAILYPRASESRDLVSLDGVWKFRVSPPGDPEVGFRDEWYAERLQVTGDVIDMPVPCSFNDVTANKTIRDYIGWVWYDRDFYAPLSWAGKRVVLRFGSVNYNAIVWVNGKSPERGSHEGGHLPFEMDVTDLLDLSASGYNWVTVAVNNTLSPLTIPQGKITYMNDEIRYPAGFFEQSYNFVYFHYAGIHRSVQLYSTPKSVYIDDVVITTNFSRQGSQVTAYVTYTVEVVRKGSGIPIAGLARVRDGLGQVVASAGIRLLSKAGVTQGMLTIPNATLWWPVGMGPGRPGQMYTLEVVEMSTAADGKSVKEMDVYREPFGVRTVAWDSEQLYINDQPFYFRGFGKHEDANIVGRGLSLPVIARDINLILWTGANSFRTSHYPYAEELLDWTDAAGIVVIDESPAIGLEGFGAELLEKHRRVMTELVGRDKNRASVVAWSMGNEPKSAEKAAGPYFQMVYNHTRLLDPTRPVTTVISVGYNEDLAAPSTDFICINRYYGWYSDYGRTEIIERQIVAEVYGWRETFNKPILVTEYGAGSVPGLRDLPDFIWTEDYQAKFMGEYFKGFDKLRTNSWFIGEMIWNFADFAIPPEYIRPQFCMKGVFTRERKPKLAAYVLRRRYMSLLKKQNSCPEVEHVEQISYIDYQGPVP